MKSKPLKIFRRKFPSSFSCNENRYQEHAYRTPAALPLVPLILILVHLEIHPSSASCPT